MTIADLEVSDYIEFEGNDYRYWNISADDMDVKVAERSLEDALLPMYPETKYKNIRAQYLDEQICYYATDDERVEDIRAVIVGEK